MTGDLALFQAARRLSEFVLVQDAESFKAIPRYEITPKLAAEGCLGVLVARTLPELEQACGQERIKRSRAAASTRM